MDGSEKQTLKWNLNLIKTVNNNLKHVIELESLSKLFLVAKLNVNDDDEIIKKHYSFLHEVIRQTMDSHYGSETKPELIVDNVLEELNKIYGEYNDEIEFDLLNEFEKKL